jgi:hypothetical protein
LFCDCFLLDDKRILLCSDPPRATTVIRHSGRINYHYQIMIKFVIKTDCKRNYLNNHLRIIIIITYFIIFWMKHQKQKKRTKKKRFLFSLSSRRWGVDCERTPDYRSRISCLKLTPLFALFVFLICRLTSGAFTIDSSTPTLKYHIRMQINLEKIFYYFFNFTTFIMLRLLFIK